MILSNQRYCPNCEDRIYSRFRHDYQTCTCQQVMVDGGMEYLRHNGAGVDESIVITTEHFIQLLGAITDSSKNELGKICNIVRVLRDEMGINIGNTYEP